MLLSPHLHASFSLCFPLPWRAQGASQLSLVSRQAAIAAAYPHEQSVMEGLPGGGSSSTSGSSAAGGLGSSVGSAAAAAAGGAPVAQEAAGEDDDESMIAAPREKA